MSSVIEIDANRALRDFNVTRCKRNVNAAFEAARRRYDTRQLQSVDIATFVRLAAGLTMQGVCAVARYPGNIGKFELYGNIDELWMDVYRHINRRSCLWAAHFVKEISEYLLQNVHKTGIPCPLTNHLNCQCREPISQPPFGRLEPPLETESSQVQAKSQKRRRIDQDTEDNDEEEKEEEEEEGDICHSGEHRIDNKPTCTDQSINHTAPQQEAYEMSQQGLNKGISTTPDVTNVLVPQDSVMETSHNNTRSSYSGISPFTFNGWDTWESLVLPNDGLSTTQFLGWDTDKFC